MDDRDIARLVQSTIDRRASGATPPRTELARDAISQGRHRIRRRRLSNVAGGSLAGLLILGAGLLLWTNFDHEEPTSGRNSALAPAGGSLVEDGLIVFTSEESSEEGSTFSKTLFSISPDGSGLMELTPSGSIEGEPVWSPDGTRIAFTRARMDSSGGEVGSDIVIRDLAGHERVLPLGPGYHYSPTWGPDSASIAYVEGAGRIYTVGLSSPEPPEVVGTSQGDGDGQKLMPSWSPDGSTIAYVSIRYDKALGMEEQSISILKLDGTAGRILTSPDLKASEPEWSPDGTSIVFTSEAGDGGTIYVVKSDGSDLRQWTGPEDSFFGPSWSPDGSRIVMAGARQGQSGLFVLDIGAGSLTLLTEHGGEPTWQPAD